jgi:FkbM family methyltransferase
VQLVSAYFFRAGDPRIAARQGAKHGDRVRISEEDAGCIIYGPYVTLPKGRYRATMRLTERTGFSGALVIEVCAEVGVQHIAHAELDLSKADRDDLCIQCDFTLERETAYCEARLHCAGGVTAEVESVEIAPIDLDRQSKLNMEILSRLERLERLIEGGRTAPVGNNRLLIRVVAGEYIFGFFLHADDRNIMPSLAVHGNYEPDLTNYFLSTIRDTDHCLDVGANFGYFTCLMACRAPNGRTIGIEPDPEVFELLRDNIFANCVQRCASPLQAAVGETEGSLTLYKRITRSGSTSIAQVPPEILRAYGEPDSPSLKVVCRPVDSLLPQFDGRIDVIKIDVEGAEPLVFRGAKETLERNPNVKIVMEWLPAQIQAAGFDPGEFLGELEALGLAAAVVGPQGPIPLELSSTPGW